MAQTNILKMSAAEVYAKRLVVLQPEYYRKLDAKLKAPAPVVVTSPAAIGTDLQAIVPVLTIGAGMVVLLLLIKR